MNVTIKRETDSNGYYYAIYVDGNYVTDHYDEEVAVSEAESLDNGNYCKDYSL